MGPELQGKANNVALVQDKMQISKNLHHVHVKMRKQESSSLKKVGLNTCSLGNGSTLCFVSMGQKWKALLPCVNEHVSNSRRKSLFVIQLLTHVRQK